MSQQHVENSRGTQSIYDQRPWVSHYPAGAPADIDLPQVTIPDFLRDTAARHPDRIAYAYYGRHITYREIDRLSNQFANRLIEHGLKPGDPVLVILANVPQFPIVHYGIMKAGGVVAALSPLLVEREISQLAADSGARIVVTLDRAWDRIGPMIERKEIDVAIVTGPHDELPAMKRLLYPFKYRKELIKIAHEPSKGVYQFRKFMKGASDKAPNVTITPDDTAAFQYTGGTTGLPKAAVLTHRNMTSNTIMIRHWVADLRDGEETILSILPFFHSYGVTLCLHLATYLGATTVLVPRFEIADVMAQIAEYQPTLLPGVPTLYNAINGAVEKNEERRASMRSIRYCISGGAPLPREVQRKFEEYTGGYLVEGYGLSEASPVTHANPLDGRARNGYIGLPLPNTEAKIVDLETREPVPLGERGEIAVRGPQVMKGYWKRPQDTAEILTEDGWLLTGDIGIMDEDGFFKIVDRQKDVVITGGENIYPREVEEVLYAHPKIQEAAVVGVPHPVGGQVVKAFIVLRKGETMDRKEVLQYCGEALAKYKVPRLIEFRSELPKSPAGKILRRALAEEEGQKRSRRRKSGESEHEELLAAPEVEAEVTASPNGSETA